MATATLFRPDLAYLKLSATAYPEKIPKGTTGHCHGDLMKVKAAGHMPEPSESK